MTHDEMTDRFGALGIHPLVWLVSLAMWFGILTGCQMLIDRLPPLDDLPLPVPPTTTTTIPPQGRCACDISSPLVEPVRGKECPVPWGKDIRFLCWSPAKRDNVFIAQPAGVTFDGTTVRAVCPGGEYHLIGAKAPSVQGPMVPAVNGAVAIRYQTTTRLFYERRAAR
jgi:hypothetical protein